MKHHLSFLILLMLVHSACSPERAAQSRQQTAQATANDTVLSLGMSDDLAMEIIGDCGGQDITSQLAVMRLKGEGPLSGLFWSLEQYNSVLQIAAEDGKVVGISYWTIVDFSESKNHRAESRRSLKSLTFKKQTRTVKTQAL